MRVALVTCQELPEPDPDEGLLLAELDRAGARASLEAWDNPAVAWDEFDVAVIRSTWNYYLQVDRFRDWVDATARTTRLWNAPQLVYGNLDKRYLLDLTERGLRVVPTATANADDPGDLHEIARSRGWGRVVVKPAVSAGSWMTFVRNADELPDLQEQLRRELGSRTLLVQPYVESVDGHGERSIVFIDGELSHAVRKSPRFNEDDESVSQAPEPISDAERAFANEVITTSEAQDALYARVDLALDEHELPMLMELELVEPSLFLLQNPVAARRFAAAIVSRTR